jgi:EamA domain-containing membrane protein RarD
VKQRKRRREVREDLRAVRTECVGGPLDGMAWTVYPWAAKHGQVLYAPLGGRLVSAEYRLRRGRLVWVG